jgi:uncharacterized protein YndB with AHSA1/START domain
MEDRKHEFETEIAASPEAVWDALTKPEEIVKWFTSEARIEPGPGGKLWLKWGDGMEGEHEILEWQPGQRLKLGWAGQSIVFEIEGRGGKSLLRLVHSGFSADSKFDDEFEATFRGWSTYLAIFRYVLTHKAGEPVVNITIVRQIAARREQLWHKISDAGGILDMPVEELARPSPWYVVSTVPSLGDSPVAVMCEAFGEKTYVTVALYLFGAARTHAETLRGRIMGRLDDLQKTQ